MPLRGIGQLIEATQRVTHTVVRPVRTPAVPAAPPGEYSLKEGVQ